MQTRPVFRRLWLAALAAAPINSSLFAEAQVSAEAPANGDQIVQMSAFEVTTTQGHGYVATNADAGFKTVQKLIDIPQDIQVVTRDMIDDIGATDTSLVMQYFGTGQVSFLGESTSMRGYTSKYAYVDDQPENPSYGDNFFVDNYVVVRGEAQVLYLNVNPTGTILKYERKPLPYQQTILTASVNGWGGTRVLLDTTGPIGKFGEVELGYRAAAVQQGPEDYFYNVHESHKGVFGAVQAKINNTTVRFSSFATEVMHTPQGEALITPFGELYTGAGPREVNIPPDDMQLFETLRQWIDIEDKASDNWDFRFSASYWHQHVYAPYVSTNNYNWAAQTETFSCIFNNATLDYWTMIGDASGKYTIGTLSQQDNFGFGYTDQLKHTFNPSSPAFVTGAANVPLDSVAAINALVVPSKSQFPALGAPGAAAANHLQTYVTDIYYQHTMDMVPKYLTAVFGWTWATIASDNTANVSVIPYQAVVIPASQWIHRFGLVAHPVKAVSIYALTATGFAPPSGSAPILYNGQEAPPQSYEDNEVGFKTDFLNGRISTTFAVFKISETDLLTVGPGISPITNSGYYIPIGNGVGEGEDGDIELFLTPNWQLLAYVYAGRWNDQNGRPIPSSYDNSWSIFTRYAFPADSALHGLVIGGGAKQVGGAFVNAGGILGYTFAPVPAGSTQVIKVQKGFDSQAFASYQITKHLLGRLACTNLTDNHYPIGFQAPIEADASPPRTFTLELDYKF